VCVCRPWNSDNVQKRQCNGKDNEDDRLISFSERATITLFLFPSIEFEWRVFHFKTFSLFFFADNHSHTYSRTGTSMWRAYESYISYEGQVNRTQQEHNSLGQRAAVNLYTSVYWLWITVWGEVQIRVKHGERGEWSGRMNDKQIWRSWLFILLLSVAHAYADKVIEMKSINVTAKPPRFVSDPNER
jgi:hypothetical protein